MSEEEGISNNSKWLLPVLGSSLCWAISDTLCDVVIDEDSSSDEEWDIDNENDDDELSSTSEKQRFAPRSSSNILKTSASAKNPSFKSIADTSSALNFESRRRIRIESEPTNEKKRLIEKFEVDSGEPQHSEDEDAGMDGEQDAAVAGIVSMIFSYVLCFRRGHDYLNSNSGSSGAITPSPLLLWSPVEDVEWWYASLGGVFLYFHYILVLWAFDSAPSTVINPLVQMSSIWVLVGSAVPAFLTDSTFMRPQDFFCYVIIFIGGIIPSLNKNVFEMFSLKFWKKPFVKNVVLSEISLGIYDLLIAYCLQTSAKKPKFNDLSASSLEDEFFFLAWCWFSISFAVNFAFVPSMSEKLSKLLYKVPKKIVLISAFSQMLTLLAFYFSSFAYAWFYQASVVHAAESSLEQALNLLVAYLLKKLCNLGRESAVKKMRMKIMSCVIITVGLFLIAYFDQDVESTAEANLFEFTPGVNDGLELNSSSLSRFLIEDEFFECTEKCVEDSSVNAKAFVLRRIRSRIGLGLPRF